jgi:hypothetical protein
MGYTVGHGYWQYPGLKTPLKVFTGFAHAFIGGHYIFQIPAIENYFQRSFNSHGLQDEIFLSQRISSTMVWILTGVTVIFSLLFVGLAAKFVASFAEVKKQYDNIIRPLLVCLLVYSLFFMFWMPEILEFWILQMVLVWLMLTGSLGVMRFPFRIPARVGLWVLCISLFAINYFGSIRWLQDINNDWYYKEVQKISGSVTPNDLVIVNNEWILKDFVRRYTPAKVIATDEPGYSEAATNKIIKEVLLNNGKVFIYGDASRNADTRREGKWNIIRSD